MTVIRMKSGGLFAHSPVALDEATRAQVDALGQVYLSSRRENEVVFFRRHSRTLVCADAMLNLSTHPLLSTRLVARFRLRRAWCASATPESTASAGRPRRSRVTV